MNGPSPSTEAKTGILQDTTDQKVQQVSTSDEKPAPTLEDYILDTPLDVPVILTPAKKNKKLYVYMTTNKQMMMFMWKQAIQNWMMLW